jgi:hypothetical protein
MQISVDSIKLLIYTISISISTLIYLYIYKRDSKLLIKKHKLLSACQKIIIFEFLSNFKAVNVKNTDFFLQIFD